MDRPDLNSTNCFVLDVIGPDSLDGEEFTPRRLSLCSYCKTDCNDNILDPTNRLVQFLVSLTDKSNVGIMIDEFNSSE